MKWPAAKFAVANAVARAADSAVACAVDFADARRISPLRQSLLCMRQGKFAAVLAVDRNSCDSICDVKNLHGHVVIEGESIDSLI